LSTEKSPGVGNDLFVSSSARASGYARFGYATDWQHRNFRRAAEFAATGAFDPGRDFQNNNAEDHQMGDYRDIQNGVNDPVNGVDVKRAFNDNQTPHERAQTAADVRAAPSAQATETFLPERLRRPPTPPLNRRTGRNRTE
jgi:hypothetical protein